MNTLEKNGYVLIKNALSKSIINNLKKRLSELKPKAMVPFTDIPWGFGNLVSDKIFSTLELCGKEPIGNWFTFTI